MIELYNDDCFNIFPKIKDKSIDLILADLPYGTTKCSWDVILPFDKLWNEYFRVLKENGNIKNVVRYDIKGDLLSNPKDIIDYLKGAYQNSSDDGKHFDAARPGNQANQLIQTIIQWLQQQGVKN